MSVNYDKLNDKQREAVFTTQGPLLVLAGAGSGKTGVLMHRIAYLMEQKGVPPWQIMAITFTNKAAREMQERIAGMTGEEARGLWVMTFHATCVRILRRYIDRIGFDHDFTIYDTDDQKTLMKRIFKERNVNTCLFTEKHLLQVISSCKNELKSPGDFRKEAVDSMEKTMADLYEAYQIALRKNNALDFDDLLVKTVELFQACPDVLEHYQERFRYIMVDEYQDTNRVQLLFISLLANRYGNLCVVGDEDQSIYKFRGANIQNILSFEASFPGSRVIKLEQNYRSTANILGAANGVIQHNRGRRDKNLWTQGQEGDLVRFFQFQTAPEEADTIIREIQKKSREGNYQDFAVLYRTNAQSRLLEERCVALGLPYQLVGGVNFYQRKEIKDVLAYVKTIVNGQDDLALLRIINVPKRGIGAATLGKLSAYGADRGMSLLDVLPFAWEVVSGTAAEKIKRFADLIFAFRKRVEEGISPQDLIKAVLEETGYRNSLFAEGEVEAQTRLDNLEELMNKAREYQPGELGLFLEDVALISDLDRTDDNARRVTLMTLHAAKGLEFPHVYLTGMEEKIFPSAMSMDSWEDLEEERRLAYVGITRAKSHLTLSAARSRMVHGEIRYSLISRFVGEIPAEFLQKQDSFGGREELPWRPAASKPSPKRPPGSLGFSPEAPAFGREFKVEKAEHLDYTLGDRVRHIKFGEGKVLEIIDGERDFEVKVHFDKGGIKKMYAGFAKLKKL